MKISKKKLTNGDYNKLIQLAIRFLYEETILVIQNQISDWRDAPRCENSPITAQIDSYIAEFEDLLKLEPIELIKTYADDEGFCDDGLEQLYLFLLGMDNVDL